MAADPQLLEDEFEQDEYEDEFEEEFDDVDDETAAELAQEAADTLAGEIGKVARPRSAPSALHTSSFTVPVFAALQPPQQGCPHQAHR